MKITKTQLKQIIKEELLKERGYIGHPETKPIRGPEAVAAAIMGRGNLRTIAATAGARMTGRGNQVTGPYNQILDEIEEYIRNVCAPAIVGIVEEHQAPSMPPSAPPARITEPGETPTLQEQIKKILSEI